MKNLKSLLFVVCYLLLATPAFLLTPSSLLAAPLPLGNTPIQGTGVFQTGNVNAQLGNFISTVINSITVVSGLAFLLFFVIAGLKWITSSGEKGRAEEAKTELTQTAIGLIVVAVSYFIAGIVGGVVGIDILNPCKLLDPTGALRICN